MDQKYKFGGVIGCGDSYLEYFCLFKVLRLQENYMLLEQCVNVVAKVPPVVIDWRITKFQCAWSSDKKFVVSLRKKFSAFQFQFCRLLKQSLWLCIRYWACRYSFLLKSWGFLMIGMFRHIHFALQKSTNPLNSHFALQELCATVYYSITVNFWTFSRE